MEMRTSKAQQTSGESLSYVSLQDLYFEKLSSDEISVSIGTQANLLSLKRLRFWPKSIKIERFIFSQFGLFLFLIVWTLLAANLIYYCEHRINDCDELVLKTAKLIYIKIRTSYFANCYAILRDHLFQFEHLIIENFLNGTSTIGDVWTKSGSFLFTVMVLTSLAFGCPVPSSKAGQFVILVYAIVGIPLNFVFAMNFGKMIAKSFYTFVTNHQDFVQDWSLILSIFPIASLLVLYAFGIVLFGIGRGKDLFTSIIFPLEFTAMGGLGSIPAIYRILYAIYLEIAVLHISFLIALLQVFNSFECIKNSFSVNRDILIQT